MKRFAIYFGMAILSVASCSTREMDIQTPIQDDVIFYASFEQPGTVDTKVYANEDHLLRWTADDRISIFGKNTLNQQYKFLGETGDNSGGFSKVDGAEYVTGNPISHTVSVYPYQEGTKISEDEVLTLTLPAEQHYAENTFGLGANTMVSVSEDNFLQYKNVGGYLMIKLFGEGVSVSSITLKGNNCEKIAGKASVTMPLDGVPSVEMADDATTEITLTCPEPVVLGATAEESTQFWFVVSPVTFSEGFTITVNVSTGGVFRTSTTKSISIERNHLSKMLPMEVVPVFVPEAIDLGLSVKWASFNLGASSPEESGDYYAWGETKAKSNFSWSSYKWSNGATDKMTKYCTNSSYGYNGFTDDKTVLDPEDDAARVNLGESWRMPTDAEWTELRENCTWTWTTQNGVNGMLVTASNGNSIFLPATGLWDSIGHLVDVGSSGYYWSSSLNTSSSHSAWLVYINSSRVGNAFSNRYCGRSVRPVSGAPAISVESVALDKVKLELSVGETSTLVATVLPNNATYKSVEWSSSNTSVATVSSTGVVTGVAIGSAVITVTTVDGGKTATCSVTVSDQGVPEAVDLGLSVKWASFNLGATKPEEYGDYFAWGETEPYYSSVDLWTWKEGKSGGYVWSSYKWCNADNYKLTKYCSNSESGYNGFTDGKTVLDPEDDAAHVNLGGSWRMPTDAECSELMENCTWTWTTQNGVNGMLVTASNGNSIFLPFTGCLTSRTFHLKGSIGWYWSSSVNTDAPDEAWSWVVYSERVYWGSARRCIGYSIRPVYAE